MKTAELLEHLSLRGCDAVKYNLYLGEDLAVFPLWNFGGKLKGYQQYRPFAPKHCSNPRDARYFTRNFEPCLWGLEYLPAVGPVFVTESIFKAMALHKAGFSAVAALGSDLPLGLLQQMRLASYDWLCAGDDDKAGYKFSRTFRRGFVSHDLDELTTEEVTKLAEEALQK